MREWTGRSPVAAADGCPKQRTVLIEKTGDYSDDEGEFLARKAELEVQLDEFSLKTKTSVASKAEVDVLLWRWRWKSRARERSSGSSMLLAWRPLPR